MPGTEHVTVVSVTHNSAAVVPGLLDSLRQGLQGVASWRLVVVDNASADGSAELVLRQHPEALVVQSSTNAGYAAGINAALSAAQAAGEQDGPVLVLNPDLRLEPGCVRRLLDGLERHGAGVCVPRLVQPDGRTAPSLRREPGPLRALGEALLGGRVAGLVPALGEVERRSAAYTRGRWTAWATGAAFLVDRRCWDETGPWDESYFLYSEETDFCRRARQGGWGIRYVPEAVVRHEGGELERSPVLWRVMLRSRLTDYRRRGRPVRAVAYRGALALGEALRAPRDHVHRHGLRELLGRADEDELPAAARTTRSLVVFSAQDYWYHPRGHSDIQLARALARGRDVLLVNSLGMRMPRPGRSSQVRSRLVAKARSTLRGVRRPEHDLPRLRVLSPVILPLYGSAWARALNARLVAAQVRLAVAGTRGTPVDALVTLPTAVDAVDRLPVARLLVNRSDKYSAFEETDQDFVRSCEERLLERCDAALYVNHKLLEQERRLVLSGRSTYLGHGVDLAHFDAARRFTTPPDLVGVPRPRVGFLGGIDDYVVDLELLEQVARGLPHAQLVLVGRSTVDLSPLTGLQNVHWLGPKDYAEVPRYAAALDVALMPWLQNSWIEHCNPVKLKEYLAMGLPVVSTPFPELAPFADVVACAASPEEFVALVDKALTDDQELLRLERRARVAGEGWSCRGHAVAALLDGSR